MVGFGNVDASFSEIISHLLVWKPASRNNRGCKRTYPDVIPKDVRIKQEDMSNAMMDHELWRNMVNSIVSTAVEQL